MPGGEVVTLPGWAQRKQTTANGVEYCVCVQPEGEELDSLTYASEALKAAPGHAGQRSDALKAMSNLLSDIQEGHSQLTRRGMEAAAQKSNDAVNHA